MTLRLGGDRDRGRGAVNETVLRVNGHALACYRAGGVQLLC